jgi:tetratricopeptide (TPR) repeat protein
MTNFQLLILALILLLVGCDEKKSTYRLNKNDYQEITILKNQVAVAVRNINFAKANSILDSFKNTIDPEKDLFKYSSWSRFKGQIRMHMVDLDSANYFLHTSLLVAERIKTDSVLIASVKNQLSIYYSGKRQYDSALIYASEAYTLSAQRDSTETLTACMNLAVVYQAIGNEDKQRKYLFEGLSYARQPQHITMYAYEIAQFYERNNQLDSAISFYKEVFDFNKFDNVIVLIYKHQSLARLLLKKGDTLAALEHLHEGVNLSSDMGSHNPQSLLLLANIYFKIFSIKDGIAYFDSAIVAFKQNHSYEGIADAYEQFGHHYYEVGNYQLAANFKDSALNYLKKADSFSRSRDLHKVESKYDLKIKEDHIGSLENINKASHQINRQQRLIIISLFIVLLLLGIISFLLIRRRRMQLQIQEMEIQQGLLRSLMQPHFLYTSLSILQNVVRLGENRKALDFISKLAKFSRLIFLNFTKKLIELDEEIQSLESFLQINQELMDEKFTYTISVYKGYEEDDIMIPPMLLQPFVENAIVHGMKGLESGGFISIEVKKWDKYLECIIEDNGVGIGSRNTAGKDMHSTAVTLKRLRLFSKRGGRNSLQIIDKAKMNMGNGVKVIIYILHM